jgi:hypothetical protein
LIDCGAVAHGFHDDSFRLGEAEYPALSSWKSSIAECILGQHVPL